MVTVQRLGTVVARMGTTFQVPIFCMDPASSGITLGLAREKGGMGCWGSRRNLVSAEDDILGLVWSAAPWPSVGDLVAFPGAPLGGEAVQASHSQPLPPSACNLWQVAFMALHLCLKKS